MGFAQSRLMIPILYGFTHFAHCSGISLCSFLQVPVLILIISTSCVLAVP